MGFIRIKSEARNFPLPLKGIAPSFGYNVNPIIALQLFGRRWRDVPLGE
jgi:hypothetical protein